jgi:hypothetical protein
VCARAVVAAARGRRARGSRGSVCAARQVSRARVRTAAAVDRGRVVRLLHDEGRGGERRVAARTCSLSAFVFHISAPSEWSPPSVESSRVAALQDATPVTRAVVATLQSGTIYSAFHP